MSYYYVLFWSQGDGTATTLDTISGEHIILVHSDKQIAWRVMNAVARISHKAVGVLEVDMPKENLLNVLRRDHGEEIVAFPEDPLYLIMLNQILLFADKSPQRGARHRGRLHIMVANPQWLVVVWFDIAFTGPSNERFQGKLD
jgi:hypothetical protein